ncbi:Integrase, catalytic core [Gossypium australe]|uniref:Integrase, catalytic core n=1 Tax=Gossypium australe TaxID=47621 RepID=A0A5B6W668_9ROSI|nr:Integrase, catalytic core [Gossypium australe]
METTFLCLVGYYRRFVEEFSLIYAQLNKLLRKNVPFKWTEYQQSSFEKLNNVLTQAPMLIQLELEKEYVVYRDASYIGLGCELMQGGKVLAYASRQLKQHGATIRVMTWKLLKSYDYVIEYHLKKTNVVADGLSRK